MKYYNTSLIATLWILLALPIFAFAAFNDVTLESDPDVVILSTSGGDVNPGGADGVVESITVDGSSIGFTFQSGSQATSTSSSGGVQGTDTSNTLLIGNTCSGGTSKLSFYSSSASAAYATVTPQGGTCSGLATASAGGGGAVTTPPPPPPWSLHR